MRRRPMVGQVLNNLYQVCRIRLLWPSLECVAGKFFSSLHPTFGGRRVWGRERTDRLLTATIRMRTYRAMRRVAFADDCRCAFTWFMQCVFRCARPLGLGDDAQTLLARMRYPQDQGRIRRRREDTSRDRRLRLLVGVALLQSKRFLECLSAEHILKAAMTFPRARPTLEGYSITPKGMSSRV